MVRTTLLLLVFCILLVSPVHSNEKNPNKKYFSKSEIKAFKGDCVPATAQTYLDINNVRAALRNGGNLWFDAENSKGGYVVPKPQNENDPEVSSLFSGALWMGGIDPAGNLKIAAVSYGGILGNNTDYYPGPIDAVTGLTDASICLNWDRFFTVYKKDILDYEMLYQLSINDGTYDLKESDIHPDILYWPAKGNPHFFDKYQFELPSTDQGLAPFWDENNDGMYDPLNGDLPYLETRGCHAGNRFKAITDTPDQVTFWIFNDSAGPHTESNGSTAIQMEVQATAFAYATNDILNDATFYQYKMINRAPQDIRDMYFGLWVDFDLGCSEDDLIGCNPERNLIYVYNQDAADGDSGINCSTSFGPTYGTEIPILGIDLIRGPLGPMRFDRDEDGNIIYDEDGHPILIPVQEIGAEAIDTFVEQFMSSFIYINRFSPNSWTLNPQTAPEYYNYLRGTWRDGRSITFGDQGYNGQEETRFVYPDEPDDSDGWSQCSAGNIDTDLSVLQNTGPMLLTPGAVNELVYSVMWVADQEYPCPSLDDLYKAEHKVKTLFDNCFNIDIQGPDAPDVDILELDQKLVINLSNDTLASNNAYLGYKELDPFAPSDLDGYYRFEGYKIFQLANDQVSVNELDDTDKARLIKLIDRKNGIAEIYNWSSIELPQYENPVWIPELVVEANDSGLLHSFEIIEDCFASGNRELKNGEEYHYTVIAYAHNEWKQFDPNPAPGELLGQATPYIEGKGNIKVYTAIPKANYMSPNSFNYGDGICIDRLSGVGHTGHFIDLKEGEYEDILNGIFDGRLSYKENLAPIDVRITDPSLIQDGVYNVLVSGEHNDINSICSLEPGAQWTLYKDGEEIADSDLSIDELNEQIIEDYGFSVTVHQRKDAGKTEDELNGAIDVQKNYENQNGSFWYNAVTDDGYGIPFVEETPFFSPLFNFLKTNESELDQSLDPDQAFSKIGNRQFYPFYLASAAPVTPTDNFPYYLSPAWNQQGFIRNNNGLYNLNNVDIVFTNDKSKWSRCIVVETNNQFFFNNGYRPIGDAATDNFDLRQSPSVDQNGNEDGEGLGMSWFPGYAIDVESGKRLNIFFGENSYFNEDFASESDAWAELGIGADMLFNPNDELIAFDSIQGFGSPRTLYAGAHHFIYLTSQEYDGCASIKEKITESTSPANLINKREVLLNVTWCSMALVNDEEMLRYEEGYIPNDLTVKLRVNNPFNLENEFSFIPNQCNPIGDFPEYEFVIDGVGTFVLDENETGSKKNQVLILSPNPASQTIYAKTKEGQLNGSIIIRTMQGKQISSMDALNTQSVKIDISSLSPGIYVLQYQIKEKIESQLFVKY